jgi:hypothetical protein
MLVFGVSASCSGSGRWGMLSFVLSATCFYIGHGRGGNTPSVSRFERGRVVMVVVCRQRNYPLRLAFRAREGLEAVVMSVDGRRRRHVIWVKVV